jgi:hypothetical protein
MDSGNTLSNEGFYFKPDGTVDFVSAGATGNWNLDSNNTLNILFSAFNEENRTIYKIDSLSESRMILTDAAGPHVFRKVPYGENNEGVVTQGFSGYVAAGESKEYEFDLPPAKRIALKMVCPDSSVTFRFFKDGKELSSTGVRFWTGIIVQSGKYKLVLTKPVTGGMKEDSDFDLKVVVY